MAFTANVQYQQLIEGYDTLEACQNDSARDPVVNCLRTLVLCTNGGYQLTVTDIDNEGQYTHDGLTLQATQGGDGDGPLTFNATLAADQLTLTSPQLGGAHPWTFSTLDVHDQVEGVDAECDVLPERNWWRAGTASPSP
jgi:hypothetical protein